MVRNIYEQPHGHIQTRHRSTDQTQKCFKVICVCSRVPSMLMTMTMTSSLLSDMAVYMYYSDVEACMHYSIQLPPAALLKVK